MAIRWPWQQDPHEQRMGEALARVAESVADRIEAEMAEDVRGYSRLNDGTDASDLAADELRDIRRKCIAVWRVDGTIGQAANLIRRGAFGRGIDIPRATDKRAQPAIDAFWADTENQLAITGREGQTRTVLALLLEGERFFTIHTAQTDAAVKVSDIPTSEITDVITHPENRLRPLLYRRRFLPREYDFETGSWQNAQSQVTWHYRDWRATDEQLANDQKALDLINSAPNLQEPVVYQVKTNTLGHRGVPEVWRVYDWVRVHAGALSDMATMTKALSMFAWLVKTRARTQTALDTAASAFRNPPPGPGGVHVSNQALDAAPVNVGTGAQQNHAATADKTELEVLKPFGMGKHWYGDPSTGNLATAASMELPAIWAIEDWQSIFIAIYDDLCSLVIGRAIENGSPRLPAEIDRAVDVAFPDAQPWHPQTISMLIQGIVQGVQYGLIDEQEGSFQIYQALGVSDIPDLLLRQYGADAPPPGPLPLDAANDAASAGEGEDDEAAASESRAQEAVKAKTMPAIEREFARALQRRVIDPWHRRIRSWLNSLDAAPSEKKLDSALGTNVAPDHAELRKVLGEYHLAIANVAGQEAVGRIRQARTWENAPVADRPGGPSHVQEAPDPWVGVAFRLTNPILLERMAEWGALITGEITGSMLEELRIVLANQFYKGGRGPREIAHDLNKIFPPTYNGRALNIARTEVARIQGQMLQESYSRNGVEKRQWLALLDGATRPEHAEAHGQVREMDEPFDIGGEMLMHPGDGSPENACGCRCDIIPVIDGDTALPEQPWLGG